MDLDAVNEHRIFEYISPAAALVGLLSPLAFLALLSLLALPPLPCLAFLPSGSFTGVLALQATLSCTGLKMRGSMRGGRSSSWNMPRLSLVCSPALVCIANLNQSQPISQYALPLVCTVRSTSP